MTRSTHRSAAQDRGQAATGRSALAARQRERLRALLDALRARNPFYQAKLAGVAFDAPRDPLGALPFTTRAELQADQAAHPPYGTNLTEPLERYIRVHQTSGSSADTPLRWLDTPASWAWFKHCWTTVLRGAGVRAGDRLLFPFSFGPFVGFWAAFESAAEMGLFCLPAGGMTTAARLRYLLDHAATVVCCTPTYALRLADVAREEGIALAPSPVRLLIVAGEPGGSVPEVRARIEAAWGARVIDHAGMTEIGAWGFEPVEQAGGMLVIEDEFIPEVVQPETGDAVPEGEIGELVLTNLGRAAAPLIRYRTGDLVRLRRDANVAGRGWAWVQGGVLGRVDDMLFIRGNNVFPAAIDGIVRSFADVAEYRVDVTRSGAMTELSIELEPAASAAPELHTRVANAIRDRLHFRPHVRTVAPGALPRFEMKARRWTRRDG